MNGIFTTVCAGILAILGVILIGSGMEQVEEARPEFLEDYRGMTSFDPVDTTPNPELRKRLKADLASLNARSAKQR
jgi:hypothetical protein